MQLAPSHWLMQTACWIQRCDARSFILPYHLDFTEQEGHHPGRESTEDHLLVLYLPEKDEWDAAIKNMKSAGVGPVASCNPY